MIETEFDSRYKRTGMAVTLTTLEIILLFFYYNELIIEK